jgi:anti-anti-sigma factor
MTGEPEFGVQFQPRADSVVVVVRGELDLQSAELLEAALQRPQAHAANVILDLRPVTFIDSSGLSVIIAEHQRANADGFRFAVAVGEAPAVKRLFDLSGLRGTIDIIDEPNVALMA